MNAPTVRAVLDLQPPAFVLRQEPPAEYCWWSSRRLLIIKDGETISLSPDDMRHLFAFIEASRIDEQIDGGAS